MEVGRPRRRRAGERGGWAYEKYNQKVSGPGHVRQALQDHSGHGTQQTARENLAHVKPSKPLFDRRKCPRVFMYVYSMYIDS